MSGSNTTEDVPLFHPASRWEEPWEHPRLTMFDLNRKPRHVQVDPHNRDRLPLKVLHPDFQCPVCLGYMKETSIVMECLHRFCADCIQKCLRLGKNECPSCRIHIPSRRSLRRDIRFDLLIRSILGDVARLEAEEDRQIKLHNQKKNMNHAKTKRRALRRQEQRERASGLQIEVTPGMDPMDAVNMPSMSSPPIVGIQPSKLLEFFLKPHPREKRLDRLVKDCIRISGDAPVFVLRSFLSRKLSYAPSADIQILIPMNGTYAVLDDHLALREVQRHICDEPLEQPMSLYYRIYIPP